MNFSRALVSHPAPLSSLVRKLVRERKFGNFQHRYDLAALERMHYAYIIYQAAQLASRLKQPRISVVEFGVAGGNGLVWMERHAEEVEKIFDVKIDIYGFDTGEGLPHPQDYRDLPYHWEGGMFKMDVDALKKKLTRATLILGEVSETLPSFCETYNPAPIAAVSHDMDFYSSTMAALKLFSVDEKYLMPRIFCYFDDTMGGDTELYSDYTGQRLAIGDFNEANPHRKVAVPYYLRAKHDLGPWVHQIWIGHLFDHSRYNDFSSSRDQQLPLEPAR